MISIAQTLHGYKDGHQLLGSSGQLTQEQQWQLLVMSDLSGPAFRGGFESYITTYPIVGGGYYCVAKTWIAPELPRPGCVWTHTLLIADSDVARVTDFRDVASLWRRPSGGPTDAYSQEIVLQTRPWGSLEIDAATARRALQKLYGAPDRPAIISSDTSAPHESLALAVLTQQWPRLRRSFRICTGALSVRDTPFDLLVAPPNVIRQDGEDTRVTESPAQDWVDLAFRDLCNGNSRSELRRFLWKFGPDYVNGREVFRALCEIWHVAQPPSSVAEDVLNVVGRYFPEETSSRRLKTEFFGGDSGSNSVLAEASVLRALIFSPASSSVPADIANIPVRACRLYTEDAHEATQIAQSAITAYGNRANEYLVGFAEGISKSASDLSNAPLNLLLALIRIVPSLAQHAEVWSRDANCQMSIATEIGSQDLPTDTASEIVDVVLSVGAWSSLEILIAKLGLVAVRRTLNWVDRNRPISATLRAPIARALIGQRAAMISTLREMSLGAEALKLICTLVEPTAADVQALGARPWLTLAYALESGGSPGTDVHASAFLLSLGLSSIHTEAAILVRAGFSGVYESAMSGLLDEYSWELVEPFMPWYFLPWDRCARLIRGVVWAFVSRGWPPSDFVAAFKSEAQFRRALREAESFDDGVRYLHQVCQSLDVGTLVLDHTKGAILSSECGKSDLWKV